MLLAEGLKLLQLGTACLDERTSRPVLDLETLHGAGFAPVQCCRLPASPTVLRAQKWVGNVQTVSTEPVQLAERHAG